MTGLGDAVPSIESITSAISNAASSFGKRRDKQSQKLPKDDPLHIQLQELSRMRRLERNPECRKQLSKILTTLRRKVQRRLKQETNLKVIQNLSIRGSQKSFPKSSLALENDYGDLLSSPESQSNHISEFYECLFTDPAGGTLPDWVWQRWPRDALKQMAKLDGTLVKLATTYFKRGTTCANDGVVAEMLLSLEDDVFESLASVFEFRLLNHDSEVSDASWDYQVVKLLQKRLNTKTLKDFRPIAIAPVLGNFFHGYSCCLPVLCWMALLGPSLLFVQTSRHTRQFGYLGV